MHSVKKATRHPLGWLFYARLPVTDGEICWIAKLIAGNGWIRIAAVVYAASRNEQAALAGGLVGNRKP